MLKRSVISIMCLIACASAQAEMLPPEAQAYEVARWGAEPEMKRCPLLVVAEATPQRIVKMVPSGTRIYTVISRLESEEPVALEIRTRNPNFRLMGEECGETWARDEGLTGEASSFGNGLCYERDTSPITRRSEEPDSVAQRLRTDYVSALIDLQETFALCNRYALGTENEPSN